MGEFITTLSADPAGLFGMLFNLLIIIAVGGLWLMWARNMKRQKNVESILAATSGQLEEASRHLESALQEIKRLQLTQIDNQKQMDSQKQLSKQKQQAQGPAGNHEPGIAASAPPDATTGESPASVPDIPIPHGYSHTVHAYRQAGAVSADDALDSNGAPGASEAVESNDAPSDVQRIIQLHELGRSAGQIADEMNMPLARINLLLRLHQQHAAGPAGH